MPIEQPKRQTAPESRRHWHHCKGCQHLVVVEDGIILRHECFPGIKCLWSGYSMDGLSVVPDVAA